MSNSVIKDRVTNIGFFIGIAALAITVFIEAPSGLSNVAWLTAGVAVLMASWWVSEAIPIPATGLVPLVLFPILGIADIKTAAAPFAHPINLLFLGGFIIAASMEKWGLHRRIALNLVTIIGTGPRSIVAGFMIATAGLSMWVSNTASTIMMLPIAMSVINLFERGRRLGLSETDKNFAKALMLAIAYSASIGGMATLIGTPPNIVLAGVLSDTYGFEIGFVEWMFVGLPIVLILLPIVWIFLVKIAFKIPVKGPSNLVNSIYSSRRSLGKMSSPEIAVAIVFATVAILWISRRQLTLWFPELGINDTSIAVVGALLLFFIPAGNGERVCSWDTAIKIPWGVLFLVGGGLSLSNAFKSSGLAAWIGSHTTLLGGLELIIIVLAIVALIVFLTELNSNTATTATFVPILAAVSIGINENPLLMVIPATLGASCAFMFPNATPPNAVVFGSGHLTIVNMIRAGFMLNLIAIIIVTCVSFLLLSIVFDVQPGNIPDWAFN